MIVWGWRSLLTVLGVGDFRCPSCNDDARYRLVRPRRWFTLFFLPVIPLKWGEQFVECRTCGNGFREEVLATPTNQQFAYLLGLGARAMYGKATAGADGATIARALTALAPMVPAGYDAQQLHADQQAFAEQPLAEYLAPLGELMLTEGRERLVTELVEVTRASGAASPRAEQVVAEAAAGLRLTPAHLSGIVAGVGNRSQDPA